MADNASDYVEDQLMAALFKNASCTALTLTAGIYVGLYTAAPTDTGGGTEVSTTTGYARILTTAANWTTTTAGTITAKNTTAMTFTANASNAYTVTDVAFHNHVTNTGFSNYLLRGVLSASVTINPGDSFQFAASAIIVTIS